MEGVDSILGAIHEEVSLEDGEDVEMMDVEEGEVVDGQMSRQINEGNETEIKREEPESVNPQHAKNMKNKRKKKKQKKNKRNAGTLGSNGLNIDRFVLDVCKRLREKKSYLVYTAVGVLGVSALSDLVKEVDAVQACGGQKTADGYRFRTGGGILWNILKARDPNAYKEIMKKGKDFEKQFRQPMGVQATSRSGNASETAGAITSKTSASDADVIPSKASASASDNDFEIETPEDQPPQPSTVEKRRSVCDRIRVPVSYDDVVTEEPPNDN